MTRSLRRVRRGLRIVVGLVLLLAVGALFAALLVPRVEGIEADRQTLQAERTGASYLRPLTRLLAELANAHSATVSRRPIDAVALTAAANAVAEADAAYGDGLQTGQRWADLSTAVTALTGGGNGGGPVGYADAVVLCADLISHVGEASRLSVDANPDGRYLGDAAVVRVPTLLVATLAFAGLDANEGRGGSGNPPGASSPSQSDNAGDSDGRVDVLVARTTLADAAEAADSGLRRALVSTATGLDSDLAEALDSVRAAVELAAGPGSLRQSDPGSGGAELAVSAQRVRDSALGLAVAVLGELDRVLAERDRDLGAQQLRELLMAAAGVLLGAALLWFAIPPPGGQGDHAAEFTALSPTPDVASVSVQMPAVDARDLLAIEELVHVGRGVRARPRDEADDAR